MNPTQSCSRCGAQLAGSGICPRCELTIALQTPLEANRSIHEPAQERIFGNFILLEELGHGGMGVVYRARDTKLDRTVALKLLLLGRFSSDQAVKRFQREAQAAAALRHPHIVAIYEVGQLEGQHYFTMEFVEGRSLASLLRDGPLPAREAALYLHTLVGAIAAAHSAGIIHRDLKPSNVLIDIFSQPRLTDFGLAKRLDGSVDLTESGQFLGSPNYVAPELAAGRQQDATPSSDLFALGAIN